MNSQNKIPVSVIVATKNEADRIVLCLEALRDFTEVIVVDSQSTDQTLALARDAGAKTVTFVWNGRYPKKRQWCLEHLDIAHDWVFFVDADEIISPELAQEVRKLFQTGPDCTAYFVDGLYYFEGKIRRFGMRNRKLALIDRNHWCFPVIDDLDIAGMGEIEGHYQPVPVHAHHSGCPGSLKQALIHYAADDIDAWWARHLSYAEWEARMIKRHAYPDDPVRFREVMKRLFRRMPFRNISAFLHSYIMLQGFREGAAGWKWARLRASYYKKVEKVMKTM